MKTFLNFLYWFLIVVAVIQFIPIDRTNKPVNKKADFVRIYNTPQNIQEILRKGCYDCHSNESKYPWYSNIQPVAWFLKHHIDEGREELNFSEFGTYTAKRQAHKLDECAELIEKDEMPLASYTIIHKEASLSEENKTKLIEYFKKIRSELNYNE